MGPWSVWLWRLLRNKRFREWLLAVAGPRAIALFFVWLERVRHRQTAIGEADQIDGMFSGAVIDGQRHVIVWKEGQPVSAYPPVRGDLAAKLRHHARRDLTRPDDLPTRRARRAFQQAVRKAKGGAAHAGEAANRAAGGAARAGSHAADGAARVGGEAKRLGGGAQHAAGRLLPSGKDRAGETRSG